MVSQDPTQVKRGNCIFFVGRVRGRLRERGIREIIVRERERIGKKLEREKIEWGERKGII